MDSRTYSMYRFFFSIPEDALILCRGFFYRFRKMLLEAEIIDSVFYVCHLRYIYIYIIVFIYIYVYVYVYMYICIYVYMYICIYVYMYMYMYIILYHNSIYYIIYHKK